MLPFRTRPALALSGQLGLKTAGDPLAAIREPSSHSACLIARPIELTVLESPGSRVPVLEARAEGAAPEVCLPPPLAFTHSCLGRAAFRTPVPPAKTLAATIVKSPAPLDPAFSLKMPGTRGANGLVPELAGTLPMLLAESANAASALAAGDPSPLSPSAQINVPADSRAGFRIPEPAGALPLAVNGVMPARWMMQASGPLPYSTNMLVRRPTSQAVPNRLALTPRGAVMEEVFGADVADRPVDIPATLTPAAGSVLPALASLFRYGRPAKPSVPLPHMNEGISPRNRPLVPAVYMELGMPALRPRIPRTTGLRIVETFEYLKPLDVPPFDLIQGLVQLWRSAPVYVRYAAATACLILLVWVFLPGHSVTNFVASRWDRIEEGISDRAAVEVADDFQGDMQNWTGEGNWPRTWQVSKAGYVRPGRLAIYQPSMKMREYQVEFLMQVEKKAVSWAYRATDQENYYASKITIVKPGPLPVLSLVRYPVIRGREGPRVEIPIRVLMHNNTPYRVQLSVTSGGYSTSIEGQLVDFWRDDSLKFGGFGFFSDTGESARVYWMRLSYQNDFIGRVCAYFDPVADQRRRPRLIP